MAGAGDKEAHARRRSRSAGGANDAVPISAGNHHEHPNRAQQDKKPHNILLTIVRCYVRNVRGESFTELPALEYFDLTLLSLRNSGATTRAYSAHIGFHRGLS